MTDTNCADRTAHTARIRELNDKFRTMLTGGRIVITPGIKALSKDQQIAVLKAVTNFTAFSEDNDPRGEHDFGAFDIDGTQVFWKIDYYDQALEFGSPDPSDPTKTTRVLTIMLASEY
jgi:hypothetical protein